MQDVSTLNTANILKVADAIEQNSVPDLGFNMRTYYAEDAKLKGFADHSGHDCGTVACIAGWTDATLRGQDDCVKNRLGSTYFARQALGLDFQTSGELFLPCGTQKPNPYESDHLQAARTLRHLAATGEVNWTIGADQN